MMEQKLNGEFCFMSYGYVYSTSAREVKIIVGVCQ